MATKNVVTTKLFDQVLTGNITTNPIDVSLFDRIGLSVQSPSLTGVAVIVVAYQNAETSIGSAPDISPDFGIISLPTAPFSLWTPTKTIAMSFIRLNIALFSGNPRIIIWMHAKQKGRS